MSTLCTPPHVSTAPQFLVTREHELRNPPGHYVYEIRVRQELRIAQPDPVRTFADLTTTTGQQSLAQAVAALHCGFATDDGAAALHRAIQELANGQIAAGSTVDESRRMICSDDGRSAIRHAIQVARAEAAKEESAQTVYKFSAPAAPTKKRRAMSTSTAMALQYATMGDSL